MTPKTFLLIVSLYLSAVHFTMAQYDPSHKSNDEQEISVYKKSDGSLWGEAGIGLVGDEIGYQVSVNYQFHSRLVFSTGFDRATYFSSKPEVWQEKSSLSLGIGYIIRAKSIIGYLTVGPSYIWGVDGNVNRTGEDVDFSETSLKFKAGCILRKYYVGLSPFFHFNSTKPYAGITVNFVLGRNIK